MALRRYRRLTAFIPALLVGYLVAAASGYVFTENRELFPFFTWSLFSSPKRAEWEFSLRILAIDGEPLEVPTPVVDLEERLGLTVNASFLQTVRLLGKAQKSNNATQIAKATELVENFLGKDKRVRYQLVIEIYDEIERWRTGMIKEVIVLTEFETEGGP